MLAFWWRASRVKWRLFRQHRSPPVVPGATRGRGRYPRLPQPVRPRRQPHGATRCADGANMTPPHHVVNPAGTELGLIRPSDCEPCSINSSFSNPSLPQPAILGCHLRQKRLTGRTCSHNWGGPGNSDRSISASPPSKNRLVALVEWDGPGHDGDPAVIVIRKGRPRFHPTLRHPRIAEIRRSGRLRVMIAILPSSMVSYNSSSCGRPAGGVLTTGSDIPAPTPIPADTTSCSLEMETTTFHRQNR
jgi:hypothetical protein